MDPLNLNIKNGIRVYQKSTCSLNVICQTDLVFSFNKTELCTKLCIIFMLSKTFDLFEIMKPLVADHFCDQFCKGRV